MAQQRVAYRDLDCANCGAEVEEGEAIWFNSDKEPICEECHDNQTELL